MGSKHLSQYFHDWARWWRRERKRKWQKQNVIGVPVSCIRELLTEVVRGRLPSLISQENGFHSCTLSSPDCSMPFFFFFFMEEQKILSALSFGTFMCNTLLPQLHGAYPHLPSICSFQGAPIHVAVKCSFISPLSDESSTITGNNYKKNDLSGGHNLTLQQLAAHDYGLICSSVGSYDNS